MDTRKPLLKQLVVAPADWAPGYPESVRGEKPRC
jgi:hypothetical protein